MWKTRPVWSASQTISANWLRLTNAGGCPELDLVLTGHAGGRVGRSLWAAGFHRGQHPRIMCEQPPALVEVIARGGSLDTPVQRQERALPLGVAGRRLQPEGGSSACDAEHGVRGCSCARAVLARV